MKKAILSVAFVGTWSLMSAAQTGNVDPTLNPGTEVPGASGSFGGAMGGGASAPSTKNPQGDRSYGVPRGNDFPSAQQEMEAGPSDTFSGGAMGGAGPATAIPPAVDQPAPGVPRTRPTLPGSTSPASDTIDTDGDMNPGAGTIEGTQVP